MLFFYSWVYIVKRAYQNKQALVCTITKVFTVKHNYRPQSSGTCVRGGSRPTEPRIQNSGPDPSLENSNTDDEIRYYLPSKWQSFVTIIPYDSKTWARYQLKFLPQFTYVNWGCAITFSAEKPCLSTLFSKGSWCINLHQILTKIDQKHIREDYHRFWDFCTLPPNIWLLAEF